MKRGYADTERKAPHECPQTQSTPVTHLPPPDIEPLVTIAENESTVSIAISSAIRKMPSTPTIPAWETAHPSFKKRMMPRMLRQHGM